MANFLQRTIFPLVKAINRDVGIRGADPRKGNFQWMAGLPSKKVLKPVVVNALTLKQLSNTDPITWAIKATRKAQITQTKWDIVPDTERIEGELDRWMNVIFNNLNPWGFEEMFHPILMGQDFYMKASNDIKNILREATVNPADKKKQLKWYFESLKRKVRQDAEAHSLTVRRIFERPNDSECRTFRTFLELLIDDILTYDAGIIVKNKNMMGELAELYPIPGQDVKIYRNPDRTLPKAPEYAYVWEDQGTLRAEYTKDELVYIMANPQQNGYGMSPLEVSAYIITASLYADEYNIDFFRHSNVPPAIFNLGKNFTQEQRKQFETLWDNEVAGKGLHRMMFLAGADSPEYIPMRNMSSRDMQMMEYLKWTLSVKCACFQISPQDIAFIQDFHRTTAQVQKELTKERGIKNLLSLLETCFNTEIVKKEFPFRDVKFAWQGIDLTDEKTQADIDIADINAGVISRNDRRKRLGMPPVDGGDTILVNVGSQFVPIEELIPPEETIEQSPAEQTMEDRQAPGQPAPIEQKQAEGQEQAVSNATKTPPSDMSIQDKQKLVRMIVNYTMQDKIQKAMDSLKGQGLGDNEVKMTLEG